MSSRGIKSSLTLLVSGALVAGFSLTYAPQASANTCSFPYTGTSFSGLQAALDTASGTCGNAGDTVIATINGNVLLDRDEDDAWVNPLIWRGPANLVLQGTGSLFGNADPSSTRSLLDYSASVSGIPDVSLTIDGLTFVDATDSAISWAGDFEDRAGNVTVRNAVFRNNDSPLAGLSSGGALRILDAGDVLIERSTFVSNTAENGGGAVRVADVQSFTVVGSRFELNDAGFGTIEIAGTPSIEDAAPAAIIDTIFEGNTAADGGAVHAEDSVVTITNSTFVDNAAYSEESSAAGGAVYAEDSVVTITNSRFLDNAAETGDDAGDAAGGAVFAEESEVTITSSTFSGNAASEYGGAIHATDGSEVDIRRSTIEGNTADFGGGISSYDAATTILNSTITGNRADTEGGGVYQFYEEDLILDFVTLVGNTAAVGANIALDDSDAKPIVRGSVIGNPLGGGDNCSGVGEPWLVVDSIASDSSCEPGFTVASWTEIALGALANNGGPTQTMMPESSSVLVGFVTDASVTALTSEDQRGFVRSGAYTAGAVEWSASAPEPDLSQVPPSWYQAYQRLSPDEVCLPGWNPSWAEWPGGGQGDWTCERTVWWDVRIDGWAEQPGFRSIRLTR